MNTDADGHLSGAEAFDLLAKSAAAARADGRVPLAAWIKAKMIRDSGGRFNERLLGFKTFRSFLLAAETAGYVSLQQPSHGDDLVILARTGEGPPISKATPVLDPEDRGVKASSNARAKIEKRLKRPIWQAFINWDDGARYTFDPGSGLVESLGPDASPSPAAKVISPIPLTTQMDWARRFTRQEIGSPLQEAVLQILDSTDAPDRAAPMKNFLVVIRATEGALTRWRWRRQTEVTRVACEWAENEGISEHQIFEPRIGDESPPNSVALPEIERPTEHEDNSVSALESARSILHSAIDRMPLAELQEIPVRVKYLTKQ